MLSRREMLAMTPLAAAAAIRGSRPVLRDGLAAGNRCELQRAAECLRLPHTHLRRSAAVPVCGGQDLHARNRIGRRDARPAPRPPHLARRHRPAERVWYRQLLHARCDWSARAERARRGGHRRLDIRCGARRDASRRHPRNPDQPGDDRANRSRTGPATVRRRGGAGAEPKVAHPDVHAAVGDRGAAEGDRCARQCRSCSITSVVRRPPVERHRPVLTCLLDLVRTGRAYVKVSAPYRGSTRTPDFADMAPLAKALIAANVQRILWGTDWPHPDTASGTQPTEISPLRQIDDGRVFNQFATWAGTAAERKTILVENPQSLYGF